VLIVSFYSLLEEAVTVTVKDPIILKNTYDLVLEDVYSIWNPNKTSNDNEAEMTTDAALDFLFGEIAARLPTVTSIRVSESQFFQRFHPSFDSPPLRKMSLRSAELILIPAQLTNLHWSLVLYRPMVNQVKVVDPLMEPSPEMLNKARRYVRGLSLFYECPDILNATMIVHTTQIQRKGTCNCGPLVVYLATHIANGTIIGPPPDAVGLRKRLYGSILRNVSTEK
jgi:Ulp1 protease family, C-terminal catalytic domain